MDLIFSWYPIPVSDRSSDCRPKVMAAYNPAPDQERCLVSKRVFSADKVVTAAHIFQCQWKPTLLVSWCAGECSMLLTCAYERSSHARMNVCVCVVFGTAAASKQV